MQRILSFLLRRGDGELEPAEFGGMTSASFTAAFGALAARWEAWRSPAA